MKRLFLLLFLIFNIAEVNSQVNTSLVDSTKIWSVLYASFGPGESGMGSCFFRFSNEVTIGDLRYFKVLRSYDSTLTNWQFINTFIRESNGKVYKRDDRNQDILIYDFNLKLNDTIELENMFSQPQKWVVNLIDSINLNDKYYKRINLGLWYSEGIPDTWIQGVGSLLGVINSGNFVYDLGTSLLCMRDNNGYQYTNPNFEKCYYSFVGVEDTKANGTIQVYPTVVGNTILVKTDLEYYNVRIYNMQGELVVQKSCQGNSEVNCSGIVLGLFIVKVTSGRLEFTSKVIKIK